MKKFFKNLFKIKSDNVINFVKESIWICRYSLRYKWEVLWFMVLGFLGTVISLAGGILSKRIVDVVTHFESGGLVVALVFFAAMQLVKIAIGAFSGRVNAKINIRVNQQMTAEVYDKLINSDWQSLSFYHSGDLIARVMGDVSTVSASVLGWIPSLITRLLQFGGTLAVILYYDSTLALLALLSAPVTILMSRFLVRKMRDHSEKMRKLSSEMMIFNEESFQNIQLIKGFDLSERYSEKHKAIQDKYKNVALQYNQFSIYKNTIMSLVGTVVAIICFVWSIYRLHLGFITYGTMTLFLQLSTNLSDSFSSLASMIPSAINATTAAGRIIAIMSLPDEKRDDKQSAEVFIKKNSAADITLKAENLSYTYEDGREVLKNVSFTAEAGKVVAFVGPSGEGKTTILKLMLGIIHPTSGSLKVESGSGESIDITACTRGLFSYVPQGNTLFSGTIAENLRLVKSDATDSEINEALKIACADEFVKKLPLGINSVIKEQGGGFSQGQLQRICIARALLTNAPIILMDEATSALDIKTEEKVLKNIMSAKRNRTCIVTTHRLSVLDISDRIYNVSHDNVEMLKISKEI